MPPRRASTRPMPRGCRASRATAFGTISPEIRCIDPDVHADRAAELRVGLPRLVRRRAARRHAAALHVRQDRARAGGGARRRRRAAARSPTRPPAMPPPTRRARTGASSSRASSATCSTTASRRSRRRRRRLRRAQGRHDPGSPARRRAARRGEGAARRGGAGRGPGARRPARDHRPTRRRHRRRRARRRRARAARRSQVATRRRTRRPQAWPRRRRARRPPTSSPQYQARVLLPRPRAGRQRVDLSRARRRRSTERVRVRSVQSDRRRRSCSRCSGQFEPWTVEGAGRLARAPKRTRCTRKPTLAALGATLRRRRLPLAEARGRTRPSSSHRRRGKSGANVAGIGPAERGDRHRRSQGSRGCVHRLVPDAGAVGTSRLPMERRRGTPRTRHR